MSRKPTPRVITVRMEQPLHDDLRILGFEKRMSMNRVCLATLMRAVTNNAVAKEVFKSRRRQLKGAQPS